MYLDTAVVDYFRSRAGGRGYQTLINEALKRAIEQENLENVLRRVIREEARPYQVGKGKTGATSCSLCRRASCGAASDDCIAR